MNAVLSVQGASAPVKKKSFFSKFTRLNMLRLARAVIPAAVLMMFFPQLAMAAGSSGQDLMASGNTTVKATFGMRRRIISVMSRRLRNWHQQVPGYLVECMLMLMLNGGLNLKFLVLVVG
ncbi:type IV conjugative transfer system pilin TraA [Escherichia coli]|uniref:type IV conjugative transfer system pilin TraA n=1 Tax=Escherichia coli TaxID=562 RepID=UPI002456423C|nr:type IV conjugative transfer system pilin TraA [Escherichia coli]MDH4792799.1 type IV conjugative transfer system pilin TraA [Escherichia coli]MDH4998227.1 type IV conjugative transfer system pilin TraA [Escherichia coli]